MINGIYKNNLKCDFSDVENVYFAIGNSNQTTIADVKTIFDNFNIMVTRNQSSTYEKYTGGIPAPNPKYKQDIEVIDGCNRFDGEIELGWIDRENGELLADDNKTRSKNFIPVKPSTTYLLTRENGVYRWIVGYTKEKVGITDGNWSGTKAGLKSTNNESIKTITFTTSPTTYYIKWYDSSCTNLSEKVAITKGTEEKPYLPYNSIGLKFSGKNKFNVNGNIQQLSSSNYYTRVENNKVIIPYSNGYEQSALFESINVKGGKTYTISCKLEQGIARLAFRLYDINNSLISSTIEGVTYLDYYKGYYRHNVTKITFTLPIEAKYLRILTINSTTTNNEETILSEIQLEEGEGTTYEPYHEPQLIPIGLDGNSIAKVNDSKDKLSIYRNGKVILTKKVNRYIFTGNENWQSQTGNHIKVQNLYISIDNMKGTTSGGSCCCNIAKFSMLAGQQNDTDINICKPNAMGFNLLLDVSQELFPTINSFKQYLLQQYDNGTPVYVDYELATPQTIELPSIDPLQLWEGIVNVELISNLATNLNVNYNIVPAMPSLEAKAEITSVDNVNIRICNENLAYEGWAEDFVKRINNSGRATIVTKDERKCLLYSPDAGYNDYDNKYLFKTNWKENVQYTFKFDVYLLNKNGYANLSLQYTDGTEQELRNLKTNEWNKVDFKSKVNKTIKYLRVNWRSEGTYIDLNTFMVYEGTKIPQFIPNQTNKFQMILNKTLRGIKTTDSTKANYIDENGIYWITDYIDDLGIHRKIGEISFDGTENSWSDQWSQSDTDARKFFSLQIKSIKNDTKNRQAICNFFKYTNSNIQSKTVDITAFHFNNGANFSDFIYFKIEKFLLPTPDLAGWKKLLVQLKENNTPLTVQYELGEEKLEEFTEEERNTYEQLQNIQLFEGKNYINAIDNIEERFRIDVSKIIDGYYSYISNDGYFIVPELDIKYLVDFNESDIPTMPEANEATVKVAGRDGDIPLSTTYEAIPFNIVCYTEDNLSLAEKVKEEDKVNNLLNSIKNKTMTFAFEKYNKFYNVKYSGELTTINYPKCVKFTIPLKSSESYGKTLMQKMMIGNSEEESNTVKEVGGIITLGGPATNPIVSLNDYSIEYNNSILKGSRVEIDSNRSTITNINSDGVKTNVMKFYNHQFPKIENGKNTLKVLSGFDNDKQVSLKWNDLKL